MDPIIARVIQVDQNALAGICKRYGIAKLFVFGSVARGAAGPQSDVDLLYQLAPGARLGWEVEDLNDDLGRLFGRPVDLVSTAAVHPRLQETIHNEARYLYAA